MIPCSRRLVLIKVYRSVLLSRRFAPLVRCGRAGFFWLRQRRGGSGAPGSPMCPRGKAQVLKAYAEVYRTPVLVETGTYLGDMIQATRGQFETVFSIELDPTLQRRAAAMWARDPAVHILLGDSVMVLPAVLAQLDGNALFWLDAHFSGGLTAGSGRPAPVLEEVRLILQRDSPGDVILIDDARCLIGDDGYPTIADIEAIVRATRPGLVLEVHSDIVRISLRESAVSPAGPKRPLAVG